jgi:hypothetical protein
MLLGFDPYLGLDLKTQNLKLANEGKNQHQTKSYFLEFDVVDPVPVSNPVDAIIILSCS